MPREPQSKYFWPAGAISEGTSRPRKGFCRLIPPVLHLGMCVTVLSCVSRRGLFETHFRRPGCNKGTHFPGSSPNPRVARFMQPRWILMMFESELA